MLYRLPSRRHRGAPRRWAMVTILLAWAVIATSAEPAAGSDAKPAPATLDQALTSGKPVLSMRWRIENVDDTALAQEALAHTLRLRLGYESASWQRWVVGAEIDHVAVIGNDPYNSTRNGATGRPLITDPDGTDLNQAYLKYAGQHEEVVAGRQRLNLDNQRFIGAVGWRQNEQTYDALTVRSKRFAKLVLQYSYIDNVNRVFGPSAGTPPADLRSQLHVANAAADLGTAGKLSVFHYNMEFANGANLSNATSGLLWAGRRSIGKSGWSIPWALSYANQRDAGANAADYDADYYQAEIGLQRDSFGLRVGRESLAGDPLRPERRFQTPLATLHVFQGWADKFLATPPQGVVDNYVSVSFKRKAFEAQLARHDFSAEAISRGYGSEWNFSVAYRMFGNTDLLLKYARYDAGSFSSDSEKIWLQLAREFRAK